MDHPVLQQQIRQMAGSLDALPDTCQPLLDAISQTYYRYEALVQHLEDRTRALITALPDMVIGLDKHGTISDFKPSTTAVTTHDPADIPGKSLTEVVPEALARPIMEQIETVLESGQMRVFTCELPLLPHKDQVHCYEARLVPVGRAEIKAIVRDISDQKQAEARLKKASREWRNTFDAVPDSVIVANDDGCIVRANLPATLFFETVLSDLLGKDLLKMLQIAGLAEARALVRNV